MSTVLLEEKEDSPVTSSVQVQDGLDQFRVFRGQALHAGLLGDSQMQMIDKQLSISVSDPDEQLYHNLACNIMMNALWDKIVSVHVPAGFLSRHEVIRALLALNLSVLR